jgi:hypothetical protein
MLEEYYNLINKFKKRFIDQLPLYSDVHDQLPPPSEKYYFASVRELATNCL